MSMPSPRWSSAFPGLTCSTTALRETDADEFALGCTLRRQQRACSALARLRVPAGEATREIAGGPTPAGRDAYP